MNGGWGNDLLLGGDGNDGVETFDFDAGTFARYTESSAGFQSTLGVDDFRGALSTDDGDDKFGGLFGGMGDDMLKGNKGDDMLFADEGNDVMFGDGGDFVFGFSLNGVLQDDFDQNIVVDYSLGNSDRIVIHTGFQGLVDAVVDNNDVVLTIGSDPMGSNGGEVQILNLVDQVDGLQFLGGPFGDPNAVLSVLEKSDVVFYEDKAVDVFDFTVDMPNVDHVEPILDPVFHYVDLDNKVIGDHGANTTEQQIASLALDEDANAQIVNGGTQIEVDIFA